MPQWTDSKVEAAVTDELKDLQAVLAIVAQLQRPTALRILRYCAAYVGECAPALPVLECEAVAMIKRYVDDAKNRA